MCRCWVYISFQPSWVGFCKHDCWTYGKTVQLRKKLPNCFSKRLHHFPFPPEMESLSYCLHVLNSHLVLFFDSPVENQYVVVSHFNLQLPDDPMKNTFSSAYFLSIFFDEVSIQIFCTFFNLVRSCWLLRAFWMFWIHILY